MNPGEADNPLTESIPAVQHGKHEPEELGPVKPGHLRTGRESVEFLSPGYFAMVMSNGALSPSVHTTWAGMFSPPSPLPWQQLLIMPFCGYSRRLEPSNSLPQGGAHDLRDPSVAFTFFTLVAGTDVLAVRFFLANLPIALAQVQQHVVPHSVLNDAVGLLAVLTWSVGVALYAGISLLVLLRVIIHGLSAEDFEPSYWAAMGALAIAVVAGTTIVTMDSTPMVDATENLIASTAVIFWSFCMWLYPMLFGAGIWRHFIHKIPLTYTPAYWTMVFPLGMMGVASTSLGASRSTPSG